MHMSAYGKRQAARDHCEVSSKLLPTLAQARTEGIDGAVLQQKHCIITCVCRVAGIHACLRDQSLLPSPGLPSITDRRADGTHIPIKLRTSFIARVDQHI